MSILIILIESAFFKKKNLKIFFFSDGFKQTVKKTNHEIKMFEDTVTENSSAFDEVIQLESGGKQINLKFIPTFHSHCHNSVCPVIWQYEQ